MIYTKEIIVASAKRTPIGGFKGGLSSLSSVDLGAVAIQGALQPLSFDLQDIGEVYMGCVLQAGVGQAPARQASLKAGIPHTVPCTTINKVCGSGMKSVMLACDQIQLGAAHVMVAGGMESMTNAPYFLEKARSGYRMGHGKIFDHMVYDGLQDAYQKEALMGVLAEELAQSHRLSRQQQDIFAIESANKALRALETNAFENEITPVLIKDKGKETLFLTDELPSRIQVSKIPHLKPVFHGEGTLTAANSSSLADGAAALVLMTRNYANETNVSPLAVIRGHATFAHEPQWFTTAPIGAIRSLCEEVSWDIDDVDLFEINEAFAVVVIAAMNKCGITSPKVNVNGGACALGHPLGASGARILVTLIHALKKRGLKKGIATLCLGGGEAVAIAVEAV